MNDGKPVTRDSAWIDREYGREKWPSVLERIERDLALGETSLARMVATIRRADYGAAQGGDKRVVIAGDSCALPRSFAFHGGNGLILEKLIAAAQGAETVIELGSGWGFNSFHLWLNGGPRDARYFALEYTEAGRQCSTALARLEPRLNMTTLPFDYYQVDLSSLGRFAGKVMVFSIFSVDQIPELPTAIYPALGALAPMVTGLHFEPAGWQMTGGNCLGSSRAYAERHDYNRDLWPVLRRLEKEGVLHIDDSFPNFFGWNPDNSMAMIQWSMGGLPK